MTYAEQSAQLAGPMALNKYYLARCGQEISDMAVQIWGGRGITQGGMGALIEQYQRTYKLCVDFRRFDDGAARRDLLVASGLTVPVTDHLCVSSYQRQRPWRC